MNDEQLPFAEVRSTVPLTEEEFAAIRRSVGAKIAADRQRPQWLPLFRFAVAAVAIAFVVFGALTFRRSRPAQPAPMQKPAISVPSAPVSPTHEIAEVPAASAPQPVQTAEATAPGPVRSHHQKPKPAPEPALIAGGEPMSIELQTSNPDIRIIWIAR